MELKGLKKNIQDKKGKLERSNTCPNSPKSETFHRNSPQASSILPRRDHSRKVGPFLVQLAQASPITHRREVT